jgi:hypothetical protein
MQSHDEKSDESAQNDFLSVVRFQYQTELELRTTLDNKANNMITLCGSLITVAIAIATFIVSKISSPLLLSIAIGVLAGGILFAALALRSFITTYSLRKYKYALGDEKFFDEKGEYNEEMTERFMDASKRAFAKQIAQGYLSSIRKNRISNQEKAKNMKQGHKSLSVSILIVAGLVIFSAAVVALQSVK